MKFNKSKTNQPIELICCMNDDWMDLYKTYVFFFADWKNKMAATAGYSLTLKPMGNFIKFFLYETTQPIELMFCTSKMRYMVYFADQENKMGATAASG